MNFSFQCLIKHRKNYRIVDAGAESGDAEIK